MKTCFFFPPCHTGCLHAIWIGFRGWGNIDVSWPESLNSRDVEGRPRSPGDRLLTAGAPSLALVVAFAGLGQLRYAGRSYLKVLQGWFFGFFVCFIYSFVYFYFWLCWVFVSVRGLSLVAASGGHSSSRCAGLSLSRPPWLRRTSSRRAGSVVVAHGPSCSAACGIFPDQGSNPCPLHWQADSQPLRHQGSPQQLFDLNKSA